MRKPIIYNSFHMKYPYIRYDADNNCIVYKETKGKTDPFETPTIVFISVLDNKNIFIFIHNANSENYYNKIEVYEPTFHQCLFQEDSEFIGTCLISLGKDNYLLLGYGSCSLLYINDEFKWILGADYE